MAQQPDWALAAALQALGVAVPAVPAAPAPVAFNQWAGYQPSTGSAGQADPVTAAALAAAAALQPAGAYGAIRAPVAALQVGPYAQVPPAAPGAAPALLAAAQTAAAVPVAGAPPAIPGLDPVTMAAITAALALPTAPAAPAAPAAPLPAVPGLDPGMAAALTAALSGPSDPAFQQQLAAMSSVPGLEGLNLAGIPGLLPALTALGIGAPGGGFSDSRPPRNPPGVVGRRPKAKAVNTAPLPTLTPQDLDDPNALLEAADRREEMRCRALVQNPFFKHINQKMKEGRTALHVAMLRKLPEDLCLSIAKHKGFTEANAVDTFGYTLLILAASKGMAEVCNAILDRDDFAGVNAQDKWGATALHWAADQDLATVCDKLLSHPEFVEANRRAWSFAFEDKTALDVAVNRNCKAAAAVIRKHLGQ